MKTAYATDRRPSALESALGTLEAISRLDMMLVPATPSTTMLDAGAHAGGVDPVTAERIYRAMLRETD